MSNPKVYLETSFISYLTARPSQDLIVTANQQITCEWWNIYRTQFDLYISQIVTLEASLGDAEAAQQRLEIIQNLPQLDLNELTLKLAQQFLDTGTLPQKANRDALHIAVTTAHGIDFLLTWNCKHIANAVIRQQLTKLLKAEGLELPIICTPQELTN